MDLAIREHLAQELFRTRTTKYGTSGLFVGIEIYWWIPSQMATSADRFLYHDINIACRTFVVWAFRGFVRCPSFMNIYPFLSEAKGQPGNYYPQSSCSRARSGWPQWLIVISCILIVTILCILCLYYNFHRYIFGCFLRRSNLINVLLWNFLWQNTNTYRYLLRIYVYLCFTEARRMILPKFTAPLSLHKFIRIEFF